jgi:hypothetical protein
MAWNEVNAKDAKAMIMKQARMINESEKKKRALTLDWFGVRKAPLICAREVELPFA